MPAVAPGKGTVDATFLGVTVRQTAAGASKHTHPATGPARAHGCQLPSEGHVVVRQRRTQMSRNFVQTEEEG